MSRHRLPLFVALLCSPALVATYAFGLSDQVPNSVKSSTTPSHAVVQAFIDKQVKNLTADDPLVQKLAREQLGWDIEAHTGTTATAQYQTEYANDLGKALAPVLKAPNQSLRNRINASVVATEVGTRIARTDGASASGLAPAVQAMLSDSQPAVILWGVKAGKFVIGSDVESATGNPAAISKLIVKAVKDHGDSGPIVEEAFASLTLTRLDRQLKALQEGDAQTIAGVGKYVPDLLDLVAWRGEQYKAGGSTPSPLADRPATVFLPVTAFAAVHANQTTLNRTLKVMGESTCSTLRAMANGTTSPDVLEIIRADGRAFDSFGEQLPNPELKKAGKDISEMSQNADPTRMGKLCDDLTAALKGVGVDIAENGPGATEAPPAPAVAGK